MQGKKQKNGFSGSAAGDLPRYTVCDDGIRWFIEKGSWYRSTIKPQPGMIIFFDWDNDGRSEHTGTVEKYENGLVCTIEGNSHDICEKKWYAAGDKVIMGYGTEKNRRIA